MSYLSMSDKDNEEDFFGSSPLGGQSSNLGSLFGISAKMDNNAASNRSLTYTAPKPPRPDKETKDAGEKKASQDREVAAAFAITAYRYVNNQYKLQGKLGIALLSNFAEKDYMILMYVSKQQPVATAKIGQEFQFNVQSNNYASFYDNQRQMWSILFDSVENIFNFAKQVCVAKYHCQPQPSVIVQDLLLGENDTEHLKPGDLVETKYTGWVVQPQSGLLGAVFDSNHNTDKTFRFKTGKGKVIKGWEEGMQGMKKTGKRFLVIPPSLAYGAKGAGSRVPPNAILAFEVDVLRIKHQGATSSIQASNSTDSVPQALEQNEQNFGRSLEAPFAGMPTSTPEDNDGSVKGRTASFNDQLAHSSVPTDSSKAKLLSRMARVGHAMLPPQPGLKPDPHHPASSQTPLVHVADQNRITDPVLGQSPNLSASVCQFQSVQDVSQSSFSGNPGSAATPSSHILHPHSDYQQVVTNQMMPQMPVQFMQHSSAVAPYLPSGIMSTYSQVPRSTYNTAHHLPMSGADILPSILLESQNNGSKLKSLMGKVDDVSENITKLKSASESRMPSSLNQSSMDIMDAAQLSFNIQRIIQENQRVKKQILERDKLVQTQSDKITDLLRQNQKLMEESHEQLERRNISFKERFGQNQEKTLHLEQEKLELANKLSDATSKICELQTTLIHVTEKGSILENQVKASSEDNVKVGSHEQRVSELEIELSHLHSQLEKLENENQILQNDLKEKNITESNLKEQIQSIKRESEIMNVQQELQNLKVQHKKELHSLQEQFQNESSDASQLRAELEGSWKEKCRDSVMKVTKAAAEKLEVVTTEKEALLNKLEMFQQKFLQLRGMYEEKVKYEKELKEQLEEFETVKERYDNLRKQALAMKQKYETTIKQLEESAQQREESADSTVDITTQVKSVMNQVFQQVRAEILPNGEYTGSDVLTIILNAIKSETLALLSPGEAQDDDDKTESSQDEDEDGQGEKKIENTEEKDDVQDSQSMEHPNENGGEKESYLEEDVVESTNPVPKSQQKEERDAAVEMEDASRHEEKLIPEVQGSVSVGNVDIAEVVQLASPEDSERTGILPSQAIKTLDGAADETSNDEKTAMTATYFSSAITEDDDRPDDMGGNPHTEDQRCEDSSKLEDRGGRSVSPVNEAKPSPPPLFDEDDDEEDLV